MRYLDAVANRQDWPAARLRGADKGAGVEQACPRNFPAGWLPPLSAGAGLLPSFSSLFARLSEPGDRWLLPYGFSGRDHAKLKVKLHMDLLSIALDWAR